MSLEPRLVLARGGLAARHLQGRLAADRYADPRAFVVAANRCPLRKAPDGDAELQTELLFGEVFDVLQAEAGWAFGQARRDGYVGWTEQSALAPRSPNLPTHRVRALRTAALAEPHLRAPARRFLALNALGAASGREAGFLRIEGAGWVPEGHLAPVGRDFELEPAGVAERHLGAPYLWGGRTTAGIDCSGLVQQALFACGRACPRDSDQQAALLGRPIPPEVLRRNDLVAWRGHIGVMADAHTLVHASGVHMAVVAEPLEAAIAARLVEAGPPHSFRHL